MIAAADRVITLADGRTTADTLERVRLAVGVVSGALCVDWSVGGWTLDESVALATQVRELGVDLIDCSSGGVCREFNVDCYPGYQLPFARQIRERAALTTAAVGLIGNVKAAERIVSSGAADLVLIGRRMLLDPYFLLSDGEQVGAAIPRQYERGVRSLTARSTEHIPEL